MKTKTKIIAFSASFVVLLSIIISIVLISSNRKNEKIKADNKAAKITEIENYLVTFQDGATKEQRYEILSILVKDRKDYINSGENDPDVLKEYNDAISEMKELFTNGYNNYIENYRYKIQVEELDEDICNEYIDFLNGLKETIDEQKDVVFEDDFDLYDSYINQVNVLISDLESKLDELTTTEEVTEEPTTEEITTEEATTEAPTTTTATTTQEPTTTQAPQTTETPATEAPSSSGGNNPPAGPAANLFSSGRRWESYTCYYEDGTTGTTYWDNYGWAYDENGNYIGYNVMDLY